MLADDVDAETAEELEARYADALAERLEAAGEDRVRDEIGLDDGRIEAIRAGSGDVPLADAAAVLALEDERTADEILAEVRDALLLGMTSAVVDVETIAADLDGLDPGEVQAKVEGRHPVTVGEYARLRHYVESR